MPRICTPKLSQEISAADAKRKRRVAGGSRNRTGFGTHTFLLHTTGVADGRLISTGKRTARTDSCSAASASSKATLCASLYLDRSAPNTTHVIQCSLPTKLFSSTRACSSTDTSSRSFVLQTSRPRRRPPTPLSSHQLRADSNGSYTARCQYRSGM